MIEQWPRAYTAGPAHMVSLRPLLEGLNGVVAFTVIG